MGRTLGGGETRSQVLVRSSAAISSAMASLPFGMMFKILIRSRLKGNKNPIVTRRVSIRWTMMESTKRRRKLIRGRRHIRRRRNIGGSIQNMRAMRIMEGKRRQQ
jgi:hypothetical protein